MAKGTFSHYTLDRFGVFRTPRGEADFCRLPCTIYTDVGNFVCVTKEEVAAAVLAHCLAAGIFDAGAIIKWALETEADAVCPQAIQGRGPHTGVDDGWMVY